MLNKLLLKLLSFKFIKGIIKMLRKVVLPGFDGVPLFDVLVYFIRGLINGELSLRATSLSYNFFMALFPLVLFLFTIIAYLPIDQFVPMVYDIIESIVPKMAYDTVKTTIDGILEKNGTLLSISIIFTFYFATRGIRAMITSFNNTYHDFETRNPLMQIVTALWLLLVLVVMLIVSIVLILGTTYIFNYLTKNAFIDNQILQWLLKISKWVISVILIYFAICMVYYFAPAKKREFRFFSAGSSLATLLIILLSIGFNFYISNFSNYNAIYGSIGTLIVILVWIQLLSMILLIGFELNASIHNAKLRIDHINEKAAVSKQATMQ